MTIDREQTVRCNQCNWRGEEADLVMANDTQDGELTNAACPDCQTDHYLMDFPEQSEQWAPDLIIYHGKCADGIVAAWACWKRWGDGLRYAACNYGHTPPYGEVFDCNVLIVDFSFPAEQLEGMVEAGAKSIVILDHHKTAQAALEPFRFRESSPGAVSASDLTGMLHDLEEMRMPPIVAIFDMDRSGARMAWDFAMPRRPIPRLVELAERYDLWRFQPGTMDHAELLHLAIQSGPMTIERMDSLSAALDEGDGPLIEGAAIYDWRAQLIEEIAGRAHYRTVADVPGVIAVECPYSLVSAVGHHLLDKHPDAPFAAMSVTGEHSVTWSLRSHDDRMDVSEVAKGMGGGGHRNAAGFKVDAQPVPEVSQEEALKFLGMACRNWSHIAPLSKEDVQDVADALKSFLLAQRRIDKEGPKI